MRATTSLCEVPASGWGDPPLGIAWLKGLTLERFGAAGLLVVLFYIGTVSELLDTPWDQWALRRGGLVGRNLVAIVPFVVLVTIVDNLSLRFRAGLRALAFAGAVVMGALVSMLVFVQLSGTPADAMKWPWGIHRWIVIWFRFLVLGGLLVTVYYFVTRERAAAAALHEAEVARSASDAQMAEARLQMLQAQVEPHFLFNTLAHIGHLYRLEPTTARTMLRNLIAYLRSALPAMRLPESTLGRELALTRAYLDVQQVRMGPRLSVQIDVPGAVVDAELPPMMLATLVENAIRHGIGPKPEGGTVRIAARRDGETLEVSVADTGAGFKGVFGSGIGLANTRARLHSLYGTKARLRFGANAGGGVVASITLPFSIPAASPAA